MELTASVVRHSVWNLTGDWCVRSLAGCHWLGGPDKGLLAFVMMTDVVTQRHRSNQTRRRRDLSSRAVPVACDPAPAFSSSRRSTAAEPVPVGSNAIPPRPPVFRRTLNPADLEGLEAVRFEAVCTPHPLYRLGTYTCHLRYLARVSVRGVLGQGLCGQSIGRF